MPTKGAHFLIIGFSLAFTMSGANSHLDATTRVREFKRFTAAMGSIGFRGILLVAQNRKVVVHQGIGGVNAKSQFDIASIAKSLTAIEALKLADRGKLNLDARLPDFFDAVPLDKRDITIRELLLNTGGIGNSGGDTASGVTDRATAVQMILATPLVAKPGAEYSYSNDGYTLLAAVLEVASHERWEALMRRDIFEACGMEHTCCLGEVAPADTVRAPTKSAWPSVGDWGAKGGAGILTTALDLASFQFALTGGKLIRSNTLASLMTLPPPEALMEQTPAFDNWLGRSGSLMWTHGGADTETDHYTHFTYFVNNDILIVTLGIGDEAMSAAFAKGAQEILLGASAPAKVIRRPEKNVASRAGVYAGGESSFEVRTDPGGHFTLYPHGQNATSLLSCHNPDDEREAAADEGRATRLLQAIIRKTLPASASGSIRSLAGFLDAGERANGKLLGIDMMGTSPNWSDPSDTFLTFARARFAHASVVFRLYWKGGQLIARGGSVYPNPAPTPLIPIGNGRYIGWNPAIGVVSRVDIRRVQITVRVGRKSMRGRRA